MLVVTRKRNESIMIWDNVEVTVVAIRDNQVKLGITAPKEIPVHRREVFDRIKQGLPFRRKSEEATDDAEEAPYAAEEDADGYRSE
jgi:carbon storage regulator